MMGLNMRRWWRVRYTGANRHRPAHQLHCTRCRFTTDTARELAKHRVQSHGG